MAVFRPFRAFRPLPDYQALIPAPPYDVLTAAGARERAAGNSLSFLHVDKAEIDLPPETDPYSPAVYEKARENLLALEHTGALVQDPAPCFYIYKQVMNGRAQVGLAGCAGVDDYLNGVIKQHEHTLAAQGGGPNPSCGHLRRQYRSHFPDLSPLPGGGVGAFYLDERTHPGV